MSAATDPIKHIVVLMLENRSFDQMLGSMTSCYPGIDGIDPGHPFANNDENGVRYFQKPDATYKLRHGFDPKHEHGNVHDQLNSPAPNGGFVLDYRRTHKHLLGMTQEVMNYFDRNSPNTRLNVLHALAEQYMVLDRWYSPVPGPTWPNRFFAHSGTSNGWVSMGINPAYWWRYDQVTLYDRLFERGVPWRIYHGDVPLSIMLRRLRQKPLTGNMHFLPRFFDDVQKARTQPDTFPAYSFIEPHYLRPYRTDQHPPHDISHGEGLIREVYQAITGSPALWDSTLLIVIYDEHGGFFDHYSPPKAVPPDDLNCEGFAFDRYGVRVPALLISPHVRKDYDSIPFDHTSILKYATEKWGLGYLTARVENANSLAPLIESGAQPENVIAANVVPAQKAGGAAVMAIEEEDQESDDLEFAALDIADRMEEELVDAGGSKSARIARAQLNRAEAASIARERVALYLAQLERQ